jgi:hypothetical protein
VKSVLELLQIFCEQETGAVLKQANTLGLST